MYPFINKDLCINCKTCIDICPYEVFGEANSIAIVKNPESCIECGECIRNCETKAIKLIEG